MEKVLDLGWTPEGAYDVIDAALTEVLEAAGVVKIEGEVLAKLLQLDRVLRVALKLPVEVAN